MSKPISLRAIQPSNGSERARTQRIRLTERDMKTIRSILLKFPEVKKALVYGSRAMGNYRLGSDIDLAVVDGNIDFTTISKPKGEFEESSLPYFVDVLNYAEIKHQNLKEHIDEVGKVIFEREELHINSR